MAGEMRAGSGFVKFKNHLIMDVFDLIRAAVLGLACGLLLKLLRERYQWSNKKTALIMIISVLPFSLLLISLDHWLGFGENNAIAIGTGMLAIVLLLWLLRKSRTK